MTEKAKVDVYIEKPKTFMEMFLYPEYKKIRVEIDGKEVETVGEVHLHTDRGYVGVELTIVGSITVHDV